VCRCVFGHMGELCKTAEPIEMPFGLTADSGRPKEPFITWGQERTNPFDAARDGKAAMRPFIKNLWTTRFDCLQSVRGSVLCRPPQWVTVDHSMTLNGAKTGTLSVHSRFTRRKKPLKPTVVLSGTVSHTVRLCVPISVCCTAAADKSPTDNRGSYRAVYSLLVR